MAARGSTPITENRPETIVTQWRSMPLAVMDVAPTVQNDWYPVDGVMSDGRGLYFSYMHENTDLANETIEYRITADGAVYTGSDVAVADAVYRYVYLDMTTEALASSVNVLEMKYGEPWHYWSLLCEVRQTTAVNTAPQLHGRLRYEQL